MTNYKIGDIVIVERPGTMLHGRKAVIIQLSENSSGEPTCFLKFNNNEIREYWVGYIILKTKRTPLKEEDLIL
jgi:hypothetical protein